MDVFNTSFFFLYGIQFNMNMYKIKMFLLFVSAICLFNFINAKALGYSLLGKVIYLDAGHGGVDVGACYKDIHEEDINLAITLKLKDKLECMGAQVLLTRNGDYDLSDKSASLRKRSDLGNRAKLINNSKADLYLSIHLNSSLNSSWNGAQVFYDDINKNNKDVAIVFQKYFNKYLNSTKEIKEINNLYMYKNITKPGVLLEVGFLSNPYERKKLLTDEYQNSIVSVILDALIEIFNKNMLY